MPLRLVIIRIHPSVSEEQQVVWPVFLQPPEKIEPFPTIFPGRFVVHVGTVYRYKTIVCLKQSLKGTRYVALIKEKESGFLEKYYENLGGL